MLLHDLERASTYDDFLAVAGTTAALWHAAERRVHLPQDSVFEVSATGRRWRLLVIAEIWCADAMNTVPALRALCASAGNVELRMIARDDAPELMAAHLSTRGTKSMPVVILIDECDTELAWWGSRPAGLQQRIDIDWATAALEDRYREIRRWYVLDSGTSAVREVVRMIVTAASISQMPAAFAQSSQAFVHRITPSADPLVWKHQRANEPIFELTYELKRRLAVAGDSSGLAIELIPHLVAVLGNLAVFSATGGEVRLGWRLPQDFGQDLIRPGGFRGQGRTVISGRSIFAYASGDRKLVLREITLDGNTFRPGHHVRKEPFTSDVVIGIGAAAGRTSLRYETVLWTKKFKTERRDQLFSSVSLRIAY